MRDARSLLLLSALVAAALALWACPSSTQDVTLAPPDAGFQFGTGVFPVYQPGVTEPDGGVSNGEEQRCYFFEVPSDTPVYVNHFDIAQNPGTHHMNIFRVKTVVGLGGDAGDVVADGQCWVSSNWADWPLVVNSQEGSTVSSPGALPGHTTFDMPNGVAELFQPHELLMLQTHYVNATTQASQLGRGKVLVNFDYVDASQVTAELGTIFATNQSIKICPGDTDKFFESTCGVSQDAGVTIVGANSHFHSRGVDFWIAVQDADGGVAPPFYENKVWNEPPLDWGLSVPLPAGDTIRYHCAYTVAQDQCGNPDAGCCFTFGGHVETQEHCNIFVYYYPKVNDVGCF
jgi:hypothetical protein